MPVDFFRRALHWNPLLIEQIGKIGSPSWAQGLVYMTAVIGILLCHEMGHFLQTVRYGVPASLPYFIPLPVMMTGTMGAVIGMEGSRPTASNCSTLASRVPWPG